MYYSTMSKKKGGRVGSHVQLHSEYLISILACRTAEMKVYICTFPNVELLSYKRGVIDVIE